MNHCPDQNVGRTEKLVSVGIGAALVATAFSRRLLPGLLLAGIGGALVQRGLTGHCSLYEALEIDTAHAEPACGAVSSWSEMDCCGHTEADIDRASADSFPASDPPSFNGTTAGATS